MSRTANGRAGTDVSLAESIAWYALLAVPVAVPMAVAKVPFTTMPPLTYNMFVYPKLLALGWLVGVALVAWAAGVLTGKIETRTVPGGWWLGAFLGLAIVSTVLGISPMNAFFGGDYYAVGLLVLLLGGAFYLLVTQLVTNVRRVRELSWATVAGGVAVALVGVLQMLGYDPLHSVSIQGFMTYRGGSLIGNPDFAGTSLVVPVVIAAALAISEPSLRDRSAAGLAFLLTSTALVGTLTRGAWIGLAAGLFVLGVAFVRSGPQRVRSVPAAIAAAAGVILPLALILRNPKPAMKQLADLAAGGQAGSGRLVLWREALAITARHPILGTGPDSYRLGWYAVRGADSIRLTGLKTLSEDPHNILLLLAATIGIPAALAIVGFVGASFWRSATTAFSKEAGGGSRLLYGGWWAGLLGLCVALVFATNTTPVVVALFSAAGVLAAGKARPRDWVPASRFGLVAAGTALAVASLYVTTATISSDAMLLQAKTSPDGLALAERAASLAPWYSKAREAAAYGYADQVIAALSAGNQSAAAAAPAAEARLRSLVRAEPAEYAYHAKLASFLNNAAPYLGADAYRNAQAEASTALELYPMSAEAAYLEALADMGAGDPAAAARAVEPLWQIDETYPNAGIAYAEALRLSGDLQKAGSVTEVLEKRFPDDQDVARLAQRVRSGSAQ